jgi:alkylation response protein AidB-like acyl-CoA dehydrogenase
VIGSIPDEVQLLLKESAATFLADTDSASRNRACADGSGPDPALWGQFAELGWLSLRLPEAQGGAGLGPAESAVLAREIGRAAAPEPFIACCVLPSVILARARGNAAAERIAAQLASAERFVGVLESERPIAPGGEARGAALRTKAPPGAILLARVIDAGKVRVVAIDGGQASEGEGVAGFTSIPPQDLPLQRAETLLEGPDAAEAWRTAWTEATVASAQQLAGTAGGVVDRTADYARQRVQFDRPIASFQVIQHRLVDMYIAVQLAEVAADKATQTLSEADVHCAKARCSDVAMSACRAAIQLHGAIGFTEQGPVAPYLRLAREHSQWLGSASYHRRAHWRMQAAGETCPRSPAADVTENPNG